MLPEPLSATSYVLLRSLRFELQPHIYGLFGFRLSIPKRAGEGQPTFTALAARARSPRWGPPRYFVASPVWLLWCAVTPKGLRARMALQVSFYRTLHCCLIPSVSRVLETYHTTHYLHFSNHIVQDAPQHFSCFQDYYYIVAVQLSIPCGCYGWVGSLGHASWRYYAQFAPSAPHSLNDGCF